jgi:hypothetical protein
MDNHFNKVKEYLSELDLVITQEDEENEVFVIEDENAGIKNLVIACADPILVMEQVLFEVKKNASEVYEHLLKKNRDIISGGFALDESGKKVLFRDTLALENLDLNELEGSINSLELLLSEYSEKIIQFAKD